jgi:hypothetical protein
MRALNAGAQIIVIEKSDGGDHGPALGMRRDGGLDSFGRGWFVLLTPTDEAAEAQADGCGSHDFHAGA